VLTQTVDDAALLLQSISGYDLLDATSQQRDDHLSWTTTLPDPKGLKLCVLDQFMNSEGLDPLIRERIEQTISKLESE
jgi:aspartyl-tRNA(Asn)/glutamyl-tRNA(Gln) amidotransferase subunit A